MLFFLKALNHMHALAFVVSAGLYAATGGDDGRVVVWMVESKMQVCGRFIDSFGSAAG